MGTCRGSFLLGSGITAGRANHRGASFVLRLAPQGGSQNRSLTATGGSLGRSNLPWVQVKTLRSRELTPLSPATEQVAGSAGGGGRGCYFFYFGPWNRTWIALQRFTPLCQELLHGGCNLQQTAQLGPSFQYLQGSWR